MAAAYHFAPLHAPNAFPPESSPSTSHPTSHFRRSISIFSRRGNETPEPTPSFIAQPAMRSPKSLSVRQKSWMSRRASVSASPTTPKGTVLHSVPLAKTIQMTALEEEMATSPNEEIISAISERAPTIPESMSRCSPASPLPQRRSTTSLAQPAKSVKRNETDSRIGEWRSGIVYWDDGFLDDRRLVQESRVQDVGMASWRPVPTGERLEEQLAGGKPYLSVTIPDTSLWNSCKEAMPTILQPRPLRTAGVGVPSNIYAEPSSSPSPVENFGEHRDVSPLEAETELELPIMRPPERSRSLTPDMNKTLCGTRSTTSSTVSDSEETAASSKRSSATSIEAMGSPVLPNKNKQLPPLPPLERAAHTPVTYNLDRPSMSVRLPKMSGMLHIVKQVRPCRSVDELDLYNPDFFTRNSPQALGVHAPSPTLSQAEQELHDHLSSIPEDAKVSNADHQIRADSAIGCCVDVSHDEAGDRCLSPTPSRAPTIPRRSRKREWRAPKTAEIQQALPKALRRRRSESQKKPGKQLQASPGLRKAVSVSYSHYKVADLPSQATKLNALSSLPSTIIKRSSMLSMAQPVDVSCKAPDASVSAVSAENVLLSILSALKTTDDLFNTAIINKGMYRVYKAHEMLLLRTVTYNQSPPAWELREWSPPTEDDMRTYCKPAESSLTRKPCERESLATKDSMILDHFPRSYMRCHKRDMAVLERLKRLILDKCQTFLRRETAFALSTPSHPHASRYNDAFWRIWCFCTIFGSNKGREDDITGQLDWLRGGLLADNQGCVATVNTNLDFEMSSVLLNAPEHFSKANKGGLSASQLFDMTELWNCLVSLLSGYHGRIAQAKKHGIFNDSEIEGGDIQGEEQILEEWTHYLLTLGPAVIVEMADFSSNCSPTDFASKFALAKANGWTTWTPPVYNGSRVNFLKEPVAKTYEEQVAMTRLTLQDPLERQRKERSRQRVASLAAEIRIRRQSSAYKRLPKIDMSSERAMSVMSRRSSTQSSSSSFRSVATRSGSRQPSFCSGVPFSPLSSTSLWSCPRTISPISEEQPESFSRPSFGNRYSDHITQQAVEKIVAMGFPPSMARQALQITDSGEGLRIDRAIEWLLRQQ